YTQGNKWVAMCYSTLTMTINGVGQPVFREAGDDPQRLCRIFRKILRFTVFISFPAMFGFAIVSPQLITIAITDKWIDCVPVMQILCVWGAFMPVSTLYGNLFNAINRPGIYMWTTISLGLLQLLCVVGSYRFGLNVMLIVYTVLNILWLLVWQRSAFRCIGLRLRDVLADILPYFFISAVVIGLTEFATKGIANNYLALGSKIAMAATLYFLVMKLVGASEIEEVKAYFKKKK
ncbi:MAG: oligosaccharide flippase family protein, partial [Muribaculaceae bacterium]|nr:oligosaccharide flippase family protein [Muribaculaceae bacterium]